MRLFKMSAAIVSVFVKALLALILFPLFILFALVTSPLLLLNARAHQRLAEKFFDPLFAVLMDKRGF
jgi:cell division protein FtsL